MLLTIVVLSLAVINVKADCSSETGPNRLDIVIQGDRCGCRSSDVGYVPSTKCRPGWTYFGGSCYAFSLTARTWGDAASDCTSQGSYLTEVGSASENEWIVNQTKTRNLGSIWIGATEAMHRGIWIWAKSGNPFTFSDWSQGQPSDPPNVLEDCLEIREQFGFKWNDLPCPSLNKYVCEMSPLPLYG